MSKTRKQLVNAKIKSVEKIARFQKAARDEKEKLAAINDELKMLSREGQSKGRAK